MPKRNGTVAHKSGELVERADEVGLQRAKVPTG